MPPLPRLTAKDLLKALLRAGWEEVRVKGSHHHLRHPSRPGRRVTVALHTRGIIPLPVLQVILDQAGMTADEVRAIL